MSKIVLYGSRHSATLKSVMVPLSLLCVASLPLKRGYQVKIINWSDENPSESVLRECPDALCVGITAMTGHQITDGLKIARLVKAKHPDVPIVWGGWHPSLLPEQTIRDPFVDIVVKGQGERTFAELVEALSKGSDLSNIKGLVYKEDGNIFNNGDRPLEDINHFPALPYELLDVSKYVFEDPLLGSRALHYVTSYGCPHRCGFCSNMAVIGRRWFGLSADRVLDDIERLVSEYGVTGLVLVDMNFFVDKKRVREICNGVLKRGIKISFGAVNGRTRQLAGFDDGLWNLMEAAGFKSLLVGSESGYQESLDLIDKDASVEDTLKFAEKCKRHNLRVLFSNLVGLPFDNVSRTERVNKIDMEIHETIDMVDKLYALDSRHSFLFLFYTPYPGTPLYYRALNLGFEPPIDLESWGEFDLRMDKVQRPWISKRQARLIDMVQYIFIFLDPDSDRLLEHVENRLVKFFGLIFLRAFRFFAQKRWKEKYFGLPFDYWFIRLIKDLGKLLAGR